MVWCLARCCYNAVIKKKGHEEDDKTRALHSAQRTGVCMSEAGEWWGPVGCDLELELMQSQIDGTEASVQSQFCGL